MRSGSAMCRERAGRGLLSELPCATGAYGAGGWYGVHVSNIGHQLLQAAIAGDGVDIDNESWRPHVAQCDDRDCEALQAKQKHAT